ncbi:hypothetical protein [Limibacillus halophilus]|uniref:Uncharacterized protein n=1 Tax=Limibacillus halophilus TaxID=1579333 RepID=A0A839SVF5_9PROT|nr:hypothetical protein [Limibacillus halophilus]MBB3066009.1 hypothetical protein [Limibacillus halophilus]
MRSALNRIEKEFEHDLAKREQEVRALRDSVISGRARRQALIDERKIKAVETMWTYATTDLAAFKFLSGMVAVLKVRNISEKIDDEDNFQIITEIKKMNRKINFENPEINLIRTDIEIERVFISDVSWAYLNAYRTIILSSYMIFIALFNRVKEIYNIIDIESIRSIVLLAAPEAKSFVECHEVESYYYLLPVLEEKLLNQLRNDMSGIEVDKDEIEKSKKIMENVNALFSNYNKNKN